MDEVRVFSVACVGCRFFLEMMIDINRPAKRSSTWYSAVLLAAEAPKYESWVDNDSFLLPDIRYPIESQTMAMGFWESEAQRRFTTNISSNQNPDYCSNLVYVRGLQYHLYDMWLMWIIMCHL